MYKAHPLFQQDRLYSLRVQEHQKRNKYSRAPFVPFQFEWQALAQHFCTCCIFIKIYDGNLL